MTKYMTQREEELDKELNELKSKLLEYQQFLNFKQTSLYRAEYETEQKLIECREEFERLFKL